MVRPQVTTWIDTLAEMRGKRSRVCSKRKNALLRKISAAPLKSARVVRAYHDLLLFLVAFPDDMEMHRLAASELDRIAATVRQARLSRQRLVAGLADTGIAHTNVAYAYTLPIARWLSNTYGGDVELDWEDEAIETTLDDLGHGFFPHVERSSMLSNRLSTRELFELARGADGHTVLAWLIEQYELTAETGMEFFDLMDLRLRWQLDSKRASRTHNRFPQRKPACADGRTKKNTDFAGQLSAKLPKAKTLTLAQAGELIDVGRATLSVRHRETEATTYPNPHEVDLFQLEQGIDVAIYGMAPEQRLSIDSFFGFVAAKNSVPVAYGGGFVYLDRLDIGLNIFREYRGSESAFLFTQILRAFVHHYSSSQIIIDSAQFGYGRAGGIQSGAFWFYYKMGFRPVDAKLAQLAAGEWSRIRAQPGYRTPTKILRRFTGSDLVFNLDTPGSQPVPAMADISLAVTRDAARNFDGNRVAQAQWAGRRVKRLLKARDTRSWPATERQSFLRLCPLIALVPDLAAWTDRQKQSLARLMRAKGGPQERLYVLLLQRHRKLARALAELAAGNAEN